MRLRPIAAVAWGLSSQLAAVLCLPVALCLAMLGFGLHYADPYLRRISLLFLGYILALALSFLLHELGHAVTLSRFSGVTAIEVENTWLRFSLRPRGEITAGQAILAALAGPGICLLLGLTLYFGAGLKDFGLIFGGHALFLLPCFGDGRSILRAILILKSFGSPRNHNQGTESELHPGTSRDPQPPRSR
jgi:hypothetical protein